MDGTLQEVKFQKEDLQGKNNFHPGGVFFILLLPNLEIVYLLDNPLMCSLQHFLKWTYIEGEEDPAGIDEDDDAGHHGHEPPGDHAEHPGEEGGQGAVAQPGAKTPRLWKSLI